MEQKIPKLGGQHAAFLHALAGGAKSRWLIYNLTHQNVGRRAGLYWTRPGSFGFRSDDVLHVASLGCVEMVSVAIGGHKGIPVDAEGLRLVYNAAGCRVNFRLTELGRAALAAKEMKDQAREEKAGSRIRHAQGVMLLPLKVKSSLSATARIRKVCPGCGYSDGVNNEAQRCDRCGETWEDDA